jgi:hypothetical protein
MDILERDIGWREEEFDYILQFLRTILLKRWFILQICRFSMLNENRRRVPGVYLKFSPELVTYPRPLYARDSIAAEATAREAQCC